MTQEHNDLDDYTKHAEEVTQLHHDLMEHTEGLDHLSPLDREVVRAFSEIFTGFGKLSMGVLKASPALTAALGAMNSTIREMAEFFEILYAGHVTGSIQDSDWVAMVKAHIALMIRDAGEA